MLLWRDGHNGHIDYSMISYSRLRVNVFCLPARDERGAQLSSSSPFLSSATSLKTQALELAREGNEIIFTGRAPAWLYLSVAHALHGKARKLIYSSPVTGDVVIFDHDPF